MMMMMTAPAGEKCNIKKQNAISFQMINFNFSFVAVLCWKCCGRGAADSIHLFTMNILWEYSV